MAIVYVAERGNKVESVLSTSMTCTVTGTTTISNRVYLLLGARAGDANQPAIGSVTDNKGNAWSVDRTCYQQSANDFVAICRCLITNPLVNTDVVTITFGQTVGAGRAVTLQEFSGTVSLDQNTEAFNNGTGAVSVATPAATDTANELVLLSATGDGNTTPWTVGAGYSEFTTKAQADGIRTHYGEYKIVSSTGVQTATATSPNTGWSAVIATYRMENPSPAAWMRA